MKIIETIKDLFRRETFVVKTANHEYASKSCLRLFGRLYRWILPSEYFDLSTLWKANREVNILLTKMQTSSLQDIEDCSRKLESLKQAVKSLSTVKNDSIEALVRRIEVALNRQEDGESGLFSAEKKALQFIEKALSEKDHSSKAFRDLISGCSNVQKKEVESLVTNQYFVPFLEEASSVLSKRGLDPKKYYEALEKIHTGYMQISSCFGQDELKKILEKYQISKYLRENLLFPDLEKWFSMYERKDPLLVDELHRIHQYKDLADALYPEWLENDLKWVEIKKKFSNILESFFYQKNELSLKRPLVLLQRPSLLSATYQGDDRNEINEWLSSVPDVRTLLGTFPRELGKGVFVGEHSITEASLAISPSVLSEDRDILLCWKLFKIISQYFEENSVENPGKFASFYMVLSTLDYASYEFFSSLGVFSGSSISGRVRNLENTSQQLGISFFVKGRNAQVGWSRMFYHTKDPNEPGFFVRATIESDEEFSFSERIETIPTLFSGYGFYVNESKGRYELLQDSLLSRMRAFFGSKKFFPFTQQGVFFLQKSVDKSLSQTQEETVLSLCHLKRKILSYSIVKNGIFSENSPVKTVLEKIDSIRNDFSEQYDAVFGKSFARELIERYSKTEISLKQFLSLLDTEVFEILGKNRSFLKILEGLFTELKVQFPEHLEAIAEKEVSMHFTLMLARVDGDADGSTAPGADYNMFLEFIKPFSRVYQERFPGLLEKVFLERGVSLFVARLKAIFASGTVEEDGVVRLNADINDLKKLLLLPKMPILDPVLTRLGQETKIPDFVSGVLFWLGSEVGCHIEEPVHQKFREEEEWLSFAFSGENARHIREGMRRTCGLRYGRGLSAMIGCNAEAFFDLHTKEYERASEMFSQVIRGILLGLDEKAIDRADLEKFCLKYVDFLIEAFEKESLDIWCMKYFKPFLCGPFSQSSSIILSLLMKKLFDTKSQQVLLTFLDELKICSLREVKLAFPEKDWPKESAAYFDHFRKIDFPKVYKDGLS